MARDLARRSAWAQLSAWIAAAEAMDSRRKLPGSGRDDELIGERLAAEAHEPAGSRDPELGPWLGEVMELARRRCAGDSAEALACAALRRRRVSALLASRADLRAVLGEAE